MENKKINKKITVNDYIDTLIKTNLQKDVLKRQYSFIKDLKTINDWKKIIK